jgi:hypothetical protein
MAADKADRLAHRWVEQALLRIWRAHPWSFYEAQRRYTLDAEEDGSAATVTLTEGASTAVKGTAWASKYVTQFWRILFSADTSKDFVIASLDGPGTTATFNTGQVWTADTTSAATYRASRMRYDLPDDFARKATLLWNIDLQCEVPPLSPTELMRRHLAQPAYRSSQPQNYAILDNDLWLWPIPGEGGLRPSLELVYVRAVTIPALGADPGTTILDWPDDHLDILRLAIEVEAARAQGKAAQIPMEMCLPEFERAIASARAIDTERADTARAMSLRMGGGAAGGRPIIPFIGNIRGGL